HRTGNGHVYASGFTSDEAAHRALMKGLDGKPLAEPRPLRFTTGRRRRQWVKNCIAHYKATQRTDAPFWRHVSQMETPSSLSDRLELFRAGGRISREGDELFSEASWLAILIGQNIEPIGHDPLADGVPDGKLQQRLAGLRKIIADTAQAMPTHQAFIDRYCRAAT
ncbi:hypothetical protein LTR94_027433, partial [Friedmanniomyces endolithicus]